jgi:uncharacterized protein DUF1553/uncharacterized protein DUF1549/concanavalin A-like lectin/glucanase superfamily protein/cytochrome c
MNVPTQVRTVLAAFALVALSQAQAPSEAAFPATIEFNRDIRPILSDKCYTCHGPGKQMGTLRFDREEVAKHELSGGRHAIVPGDPANSVIIQRVTSTNPAQRMPMGGEALSARETEMLRRWIQQGAQWQAHWSFIPPKRPELPVLKDKTWAKNPIDAFVLQRLERENLRPSPEASRAALLRRVSLDLTGLPATPAEIDAFQADKSPNAYEKVVDRLLQSPRYGERMSQPWLDASRYADTNGYQSDGERVMWRWRDWVINAFNKNMRFDQFVVEQLAGDLLPNATLDQKIATGFNRNHRGNSEGGIVPEEYAAEYVMDRVDTTSTVFLGLTVGCARCHDHKYDPILQRDYYQLFSYFNNIAEGGKARRIGNSPPWVKAPTEDQQKQLHQFDSRFAAATVAFQKFNPELKRGQQIWEASLDKSQRLYWGPARGLVAHYGLDGDLNAKVEKTVDGKPSPLKPQEGDTSFAPGRVGQAATFDGKRFIQGGDIAGFESHGSYDDKYSIAAWIYPTAGTGAIVSKAQDIDEPLGHELVLKDGKVQYNYASKWLDEAIRVQTEKAISLNQWHQVTLTYDGSRYAEGVKIYVDGEAWKFEIQVDDLNNPRPLKRYPLRIGGGGGPQNRFQGSIADIRIYDRDLKAAEAKVLADPATVNEIAAVPADRRTPAQTDKIRDYFLENAAAANIREAWKQVLAAKAQRDEYYDGIQTVMVMEEMPVPRESHILLRGAYDRPGDKVTPKLPAALTADQSKYPPNRLGLAKWLTDPSHPLMARVTVNRFWQAYFGTGIVKTTEDFGSQGEQPSHPELLDWLATEFIRTGWDVRALQKTIVMSATYRQDSKMNPDIVQRDPENRLLSHGPNFRLPAATIRDQALAISGLLVNELGGPSVKPYQPEGLWKELAAEADYSQDHGKSLYRRSLYTYWRRTVPPPSMANFDASSRESCVVRDNFTNTPLQALDLMNDVTFVEAARVFAQRILREGGKQPAERIDFAFRNATGRVAKPAERQVVLDYLNFQLDSFKTRPDAAVKYVSQGEAPRDPRLDPSELAAYTSVASLILNLNQTVTKE